MSKLKVLDLFYDGHKVFHEPKGYACVWIDGKTKKCHVLEWEKHNGPKPEGFEIHHQDENKANFHIDNLELLTNSDHQRIHAGWVRSGGEWVAKPCSTCAQVLPLSAFYERKGYTPSANCRPCHIEKTKVWASKNPEKRKEISLAYYYRSKQNAR